SVIKDENIQVQTKAVVKEVNGKFKGFNVKIESTGSSKKPVEIDLKASAIIVATGYHLFDAEKMPQFYYGKHGNVLTGLDFEEMFKDNILNQKPLFRPSDKGKLTSVVFILCVGSRDEKYQVNCCRVGCLNALKQAYELKQLHGEEIDVYICYNDIRAAGKEEEELYRRTREAGVLFIKGLPSEIKPLSENQLNIEVFDLSTYKLLSITADLLVLETALSPNTDLKDKLNLPLGEDGFYREVDIKFNTIETPIKGVFLAGTSQGPKTISETIEHASFAALEAATLISRKTNR
ncbi:MAG TPA: CoB--CoM heterodisulfide reductase iron-sulfur subunit A family protein, partial [Thermoplasmata archaeon]|nr:CoB--CoM heterodisulfide reductase iron-sulfur subunit A family protein [Thermoplasmata archaeon]